MSDQEQQIPKVEEKIPQEEVKEIVQEKTTTIEEKPGKVEEKTAPAPKEERKKVMQKTADFEDKPFDIGIPTMYSKMPIQETIYSGLLRIKAILDKPENYFDKVGTVGGWARTVRKAEKNTLLFIELTDGSCLGTLQVVIKDTIGKCFEDVIKTSTGASQKFKGTLIPSPAEGQSIEMLVESVEIHTAQVLGHNLSTKTYPLSKKFHNPETLRQHMHLRSRSNMIGASMRIRNSMSFATHLFFETLGFMYIHTPIITCSDCEGAGEMFQTTTMLPKDNKPESIPFNKKKKQIDFTQDFFARQTYLTVSGQLNVEPFACSMTNAYTFGPTFRAEASFTSRHLAEFWMIEPELAFAGLKENMQCAEDYIKFCIDYCLKNNMDDLQFFNEKLFKDKKGDDLIMYLKGIVNSEFKKQSYTEAIDILLEAIKNGKTFEIPVEWGMDLKSEHERWLCEEYIQGPLFLYNYPTAIKPFYMKVNEGGKTVQAMDLLVPLIGEVIGGSVREDDVKVLEDRIKACGLNKKDYEWYIDLRRYGTVPHAGFGVGLERLVMLVSAMDNIRDVIPYPRWMGNVMG